MLLLFGFISAHDMTAFMAFGIFSDIAAKLNMKTDEIGLLSEIEIHILNLNIVLQLVYVVLVIHN